jgi:hypothetical protein
VLAPATDWIAALDPLVEEIGSTDRARSTSSTATRTALRSSSVEDVGAVSHSKAAFELAKQVRKVWLNAEGD